MCSVAKKRSSASDFPLVLHNRACVFVCVFAGSGPPIHPDQSDPQSSGRPEEAELPRAASVGSEDGGSAAGLLLPAAPRPADRQQTPR